MNEGYVSPLGERYGSAQMQSLFSEKTRVLTFRRLWIALARAEKELGLEISDEQIAEMEAHLFDDVSNAAKAYEKTLRHDVMAQIHAWGDVCPKARPIIHLGATSCYVGDNTDVIVMREALRLVKGKALKVISDLADFAMRWKDEPALAYTHLQSAQLTTVGKRATLWVYDLLQDIEQIDFVLSGLCLLGSKGTTGTQASFLRLFDGDAEKVKEAEKMIAREMGFEKVVPVSGQTYSRKADYRVLSALSGIAQSAYKFSNDLRLLQSFKEIEEPFESGQVGSSAMPYKRNPMRSERISGLCRYVIAKALDPAFTSGTQWMERTLDDSSNRRLAIPEAFLATDAILDLYINVTSGLVVYPKMIARRVAAELPFMASENILMDAVKRGGDRQDLHEKLRKHAQAAGRAVKEEGKDNDLLDRIAADLSFALDREALSMLLDPKKYIGLAPEQTEEFILSTVRPLLAANKPQEGSPIEL